MIEYQSVDNSFSYVPFVSIMPVRILNFWLLSAVNQQTGYFYDIFDVILFLFQGQRSQTTSSIGTKVISWIERSTLENEEDWKIASLY